MFLKTRIKFTSKRINYRTYMPELWSIKYCNVSPPSNIIVNNNMNVTLLIILITGMYCVRRNSIICNCQWVVVLPYLLTCPARCTAQRSARCIPGALCDQQQDPAHPQVQVSGPRPARGPLPSHQESRRHQEASWEEPVSKARLTYLPLSTYSSVIII